MINDLDIKFNFDEVNFRPKAVDELDEIGTFDTLEWFNSYIKELKFELKYNPNKALKKKLREIETRKKKFIKEGYDKNENF